MSSIDVHTPSSAAGDAEVIDLDAPGSRDPARVGAKAAAVARARDAGLPALPGFVIPTGAAAAMAAGADGDTWGAWDALTAGGNASLVVRSSSTVEDGEHQSMAGAFTSVVDVRGWPDFLDAVTTVVRSAGAAGARDMAVLVQPYVDAVAGGVLFSVDPVSGRTDRLLVAVAEGGPQRLVSGETDGVHLTLSRRGRLVSATGPVPAGLDRRRTCRALAELARACADLFGGPQDIEWALTADGRLRLLQSRPITTLHLTAQPTGPIYGPGPVAETFPAPLAPLEADLWLPPVEAALRRVLNLLGVAPRRRLRTEPLLVTVSGRPAVNLELLGDAPEVDRSRVRRWLRRLDPRPPARRLGAAWRVGRIRAALTPLATDALTAVDRDLAAVPGPTELDDGALLRVLQRSHQTLVSVHGYEMLAGQLLATSDPSHGTSASGAALRTLFTQRRAHPDVADAELIARHPLLLALVPPVIGPAQTLPASPSRLPVGPAAGADPNGELREALRLRVRWVHELTARAAYELGQRLARAGALATAEDVRWLTLVELEALIARGTVPSTRRSPLESSAPLPAAFRLTANGDAIPVVSGVDAGATGGRAAGGGRGAGPVSHGPQPAPGSVLVVRTLDPHLASLLPDLGGLVAETGSVLSHLAIVARELGVPTVVAYPDALERFSEGMWVVVDGTAGAVEVVELVEARDHAGKRGAS